MERPLRFVIVAAGRTGSNLLVSLLRSHPQAFVGGEIFNLDYVERTGIPWAVEGVRASPKLLAWMRADPAAYLERLFELASGRGPRAIGFKLLYAQASPAGAALERLTDDRSVRVIHLKRRNLLRQYLSLQRAKTTDVWVRKADHPKPPALRLEPADCFGYFQAMERNRERFDALFGAHERLELFYEDLAADPCGIGDRAAAFLGLEPCVALRVQRRKVATDPLRDAIVNYDELAATLGERAHYLDT